MARKPRKPGKPRKLSAAARANISLGLARALGPTRGLDPYEAHPRDKKPGDRKAGVHNPTTGKRDVQRPGKPAPGTSKAAADGFGRPTKAGVPDPATGKRNIQRPGHAPGARPTDGPATKRQTKAAKKARKQHTRDLEAQGWGEKGRKKQARQDKKNAARAELSAEMDKARNKGREAAETTKEFGKELFADLEAQRKVRKRRKQARTGRSQVDREATNKQRIVDGTLDADQAAQREQQGRTPLNKSGRRNVSQDRDRNHPGEGNYPTTEQNRPDANPNGRGLGDPIDHDPYDWTTPADAPQQRPQRIPRPQDTTTPVDPNENEQHLPGTETDNYDLPQRPQKRPNTDVPGGGHQASADYLDPQAIRTEKRYRKDLNDLADALDGKPDQVQKFRNRTEAANQAADTDTGDPALNRANRRRATRMDAMAEDLGLHDGDTIRRPDDADTHQPDNYTTTVDGQRPIHRTTAAEQNHGTDSPEAAAAREQYGQPGTDAVNPADRGLPTATEDTPDLPARDADGNWLDETGQYISPQEKARRENENGAFGKAWNDPTVTRGRAKTRDERHQEELDQDQARREQHAAATQGRQAARAGRGQRQRMTPDQQAAELNRLRGNNGNDNGNGNTPDDQPTPPRPTPNDMAALAPRRDATTGRARNTAKGRNSAAKGNRADQTTRRRADEQRATNQRAKRQADQQAEIQRIKDRKAKEQAAATTPKPEDPAARRQRIADAEKRQAEMNAAARAKREQQQAQRPEPRPEPQAPTRDEYDDLADQRADRDQFNHLDDDALAAEAEAINNRWNGDLSDFTPQGMTDEMNLEQVRADRARLADINEELATRQAEQGNYNTGTTVNNNDDEAFQALTDADMPHGEDPTSSKGLLDDLDDDDLADLTNGPLAAQARQELARRAADRTAAAPTRAPRKNSRNLSTESDDAYSPAALAALEAEHHGDDATSRAAALQRDLTTMDDKNVQNLATHGDTMAADLANQELDRRHPFRPGGALEQRAEKFSSTTAFDNYVKKNNLTQDEAKQLADLGAAKGNRHLYKRSTYADQYDGYLEGNITDARIREAIEGIDHDNWDALKSLTDRAYGAGTGRDRRGESDRDGHAEELLGAMFDEVGYVPDLHNFIRTANGLPPEGPTSTDEITEHFTERRDRAVRNATGKRGKRLTPLEHRTRDLAEGRRRANKWLETDRTDTAVKRRLDNLEAGKAGSPLKPDVQEGHTRAIRDEAMRRGIIPTDKDYRDRHTTKATEKTPDAPKEAPKPAPKRSVTNTANAATKARDEHLAARRDKNLTPIQKAQAEKKWRDAEVAHAKDLERVYRDNGQTDKADRMADQVADKQRRANAAQRRLDQARIKQAEKKQAEAQKQLDAKRAELQAADDKAKAETAAHKAKQAARQQRAQDLNNGINDIANRKAADERTSTKAATAAIKKAQDAQAAEKKANLDRINADNQAALAKKNADAKAAKAQETEAKAEDLTTGINRIKGRQTVAEIRTEKAIREAAAKAQAQQEQEQRDLLDSLTAELKKEQDAKKKPTLDGTSGLTQKAETRAEKKASRKQELSTREARRQQVFKDNNAIRARVRADASAKDNNATDVDKAIAEQEARHAETKEAQAFADFWDNETDSAEVKREREKAHATLDRATEAQRNADLLASAHKANLKLEAAAQKAHRKHAAQKGDNYTTRRDAAEAENNYRQAIATHLRDNNAGDFTQAKADAAAADAARNLKIANVDIERQEAITRDAPTTAQDKTKREAARRLTTNMWGGAEWEPGKLANLTDKDLDDIEKSATHDTRNQDSRISRTGQGLVEAVNQERLYRAKDHTDPRVTYGPDGQAIIHADNIDDALDQIGDLDRLLPPNSGTSIRKPGHITARIGNKSVFITPDLDAVGGPRRVTVQPVGDRTSPQYAKGTNVLETDLKKALTKEIGTYTEGRNKQQHMIDTVQQAQNTIAAAGGVDKLTTDQAEEMTRQFRQSATDFPDNAPVIQEQANNIRRAAGLPEVDITPTAKTSPTIDGTSGISKAPTAPKAPKRASVTPKPDTDNPYMKAKGADRDLMVYDAIRGEAYTTGELSDVTGMTPSTLRASLNRLEQRGLIGRDNEAGVSGDTNITGGRVNIADMNTWSDNFRDGGDPDDLITAHREGRDLPKSDTPKVKTAAQVADEWATTIDPGRLSQRARDMTDIAKTMKGMNAKRAEAFLKKSGYGTDIAEFNERRKAVNRRIQAIKRGDNGNGPDGGTGGTPAPTPTPTTPRPTGGANLDGTNGFTRNVETILSQGLNNDGTPKRSRFGNRQGVNLDADNTPDYKPRKEETNPKNSGLYVDQGGTVWDAPSGYNVRIFDKNGSNGLYDLPFHYQPTKGDNLTIDTVVKRYANGNVIVSGTTANGDRREVKFTPSDRIEGRFRLAANVSRQTPQQFHATRDADAKYGPRYTNERSRTTEARRNSVKREIAEAHIKENPGRDTVPAITDAEADAYAADRLETRIANNHSKPRPAGIWADGDRPTTSGTYGRDNFQAADGTVYAPLHDVFIDRINNTINDRDTSLLDEPNNRIMSNDHRLMRVTGVKWFKSGPRFEGVHEDGSKAKFKADQWNSPLIYKARLHSDGTPIGKSDAQTMLDHDNRDTIVNDMRSDSDIDRLASDNDRARTDAARQAIIDRPGNGGGNGGGGTTPKPTSPNLDGSTGLRGNKRGQFIDKPYSEWTDQELQDHYDEHTDYNGKKNKGRQFQHSTGGTARDAGRELQRRGIDPSTGKKAPAKAEDAKPTTTAKSSTRKRATSTPRPRSSRSEQAEARHNAQVAETRKAIQDKADTLGGADVYARAAQDVMVGGRPDGMYGHPYAGYTDQELAQAKAQAIAQADTNDYGTPGRQVAQSVNVAVGKEQNLRNNRPEGVKPADEVLNLTSRKAVKDYKKAIEPLQRDRSLTDAQRDAVQASLRTADRRLAHLLENAPERPETTPEQDRERRMNRKATLKDWTHPTTGEKRRYISNAKSLLGLEGQRGGKNGRSTNYYGPDGKIVFAKNIKAWADEDGSVHVSGIPEDLYLQFGGHDKLAGHLQKAVNKTTGKTATHAPERVSKREAAARAAEATTPKTTATPDTVAITPASTRQDIQAKYKGKTLATGGRLTPDGARAMADYLTTDEGRKEYTLKRNDEKGDGRPGDGDVYANTATAFALQTVATSLGIDLEDVADHSDYTEHRRLTAKRPETLARNIADMLDVDMGNGTRADRRKAKEAEAEAEKATKVAEAAANAPRFNSAEDAAAHMKDNREALQRGDAINLGGTVYQTAGTVGSRTKITLTDPDGNRHELNLSRRALADDVNALMGDDTTPAAPKPEKKPTTPRLDGTNGLAPKAPARTTAAPKPPKALTDYANRPRPEGPTTEDNTATIKANTTPNPAHRDDSPTAVAKITKAVAGNNSAAHINPDDSTITIGTGYSVARVNYPITPDSDTVTLDGQTIARAIKEANGAPLTITKNGLYYDINANGRTITKSRDTSINIGPGYDRLTEGYDDRDTINVNKKALTTAISQIKKAGVRDKNLHVTIAEADDTNPPTITLAGQNAAGAVISRTIPLPNSRDIGADSYSVKHADLTAAINTTTGGTTIPINHHRNGLLIGQPDNNPVLLSARVMANGDDRLAARAKSEVADRKTQAEQAEWDTINESHPAEYLHYNARTLSKAIDEQRAAVATEYPDAKGTGVVVETDGNGAITLRAAADTPDGRQWTSTPTVIPAIGGLRTRMVLGNGRGLQDIQKKALGNSGNRTMRIKGGFIVGGPSGQGQVADNSTISIPDGPLGATWNGVDEGRRRDTLGMISRMAAHVPEGITMPNGATLAAMSVGELSDLLGRLEAAADTKKGK